MRFASAKHRAAFRRWIELEVALDQDPIEALYARARRMEARFRGGMRK